jgi:hypothetical protein
MRGVAQPCKGKVQSPVSHPKPAGRGKWGRAGKRSGVERRALGKVTDRLRVGVLLPLLLVFLPSLLTAQEDTVRLGDLQVIVPSSPGDTVFLPGDTVYLPGDTVIVTDTIVMPPPPPDTVFLPGDTIVLPPDTVMVVDTLVLPPDTVVVVDTLEALPDGWMAVPTPGPNTPPGWWSDWPVFFATGPWPEPVTFPHQAPYQTEYGGLLLEFSNRTPNVFVEKGDLLVYATTEEVTAELGGRVLRLPMPTVPDDFATAAGVMIRWGPGGFELNTAGNGAVVRDTTYKVGLQDNTADLNVGGSLERLVILDKILAPDYVPPLPPDDTVPPERVPQSPSVTPLTDGSGWRVAWVESPSPDVVDFRVSYGANAGGLNGEITTTSRFMTITDPIAPGYVCVFARDGAGNESEAACNAVRAQ